nr:Chain A, PROLINE-RICH LIGAND PLR1 (AFAPPLPRR) [unidentified]1PRM_A Chain A, PROLINE-RICH LIGAND PLR1 (AFAPPLPRR) [unidentified]
AFAPPLPRR